MINNVIQHDIDRSIDGDSHPSRYCRIHPASCLQRHCFLVVGQVVSGCLLRSNMCIEMVVRHWQRDSSGGYSLPIASYYKGSRICWLQLQSWLGCTLISRIVQLAKLGRGRQLWKGCILQMRWLPHTLWILRWLALFRRTIHSKSKQHPGKTPLSKDCDNWTQSWSGDCCHLCDWDEVCLSHQEGADPQLRAATRGQHQALWSHGLEIRRYIPSGAQQGYRTACSSRPTRLRLPSHSLWGVLQLGHEQLQGLWCLWGRYHLLG